MLNVRKQVEERRPARQWGTTATVESKELHLQILEVSEVSFKAEGHGTVKAFSSWPVSPTNTARAVGQRLR
jgi:hypothetical protein